MYKVLLLFLIVFVSCEKGCNEDLGKIITKEVVVESFNQITVFTGIKLIIKESPTQKIIIETGTNRMDNVHISVVDGLLDIEADSNCSLRPSYEPVLVYVSTPSLKTLRNSSEYTIKSDGILTFPQLKLLTESHKSNYVNLGDFDLKINNQKLQITSNGLSKIHIEGTTEQLFVNYYSGIGKFEGKDLIAQHIKFFHKGENKIEINPQLSLKGDLYSTGDVFSYNHPNTVDVKSHFKGKLIYQ
jgi:hypothetical protein